MRREYFEYEMAVLHFFAMKKGDLIFFKPHIVATI